MDLKGQRQRLNVMLEEGQRRPVGVLSSAEIRLGFRDLIERYRGQGKGPITTASLRLGSISLSGQVVAKIESLDSAGEPCDCSLPEATQFDVTVTRPSRGYSGPIEVIASERWNMLDEGMDNRARAQQTLTMLNDPSVSPAD